MPQDRAKKQLSKAPSLAARLAGATLWTSGSPVLRYGVGGVVVGLAILLSVLLAPFTYATPFLFLYPAVLFATWVGGLGPGLLATFIGSIAANYYLLSPYRAFSLDASGLMRTLFFALTFATICWITGLARAQLHSQSERLATALRHSDAELGAERERWKQVVQGIADEVWVADAQGRMSVVNLPAVTEMRLDEFKNKSYEQVMDAVEILNPDGQPRPREQAPLLRALHGDTVRGEEIMQHRATGRTRWRHYSAAPIRDTTGAIVGSVAVVRDITEQKEAQERLTLESAALEAAANSIVITDRDGVILWVNPAFTQLTGYSAAEVIGNTPRMLNSGEHDPQFYCDMWKTIVAGDVWQGEVVNQRKNGSRYLEEMTITPVRPTGGEITHFIAIKVDVTARKQAERALIQNEKLAATGRLAATIAHEINNPLEAMTNLLYLISPTVTDGNAREYLDLMKKQLDGITHIARQTLRLHRESDHPAKFNVSDLIVELLDLYQPKAKQHGITISVRADSEGTMLGFIGEIRQVVSNLLLNAIEATPSGGRIIIHLRAGAHRRNPKVQGYRISIADNGTGVDPRDSARLFEPFFTTKGEKGTGLGLWVSAGIVQRAGGTLRMWSSRLPSKTGTCFCVFLPAEVPASHSEGRRRFESFSVTNPPPPTRTQEKA